MTFSHSWFYKQGKYYVHFFATLFVYAFSGNASYKQAHKALCISISFISETYIFLLLLSFVLVAHTDIIIVGMFVIELNLEK